MGAAIITVVKLIEVTNRTNGSCDNDCTFAVLLLVNLGKSYILLLSTEMKCVMKGHCFH